MIWPSVWHDYWRKSPKNNQQLIALMFVISLPFLITAWNQTHNISGVLSLQNLPDPSNLRGKRLKLRTF
jgi:hypothetical protein